MQIDNLNFVDNILNVPSTVHTREDSSSAHRKDGGTTVRRGNRQVNGKSSRSASTVDEYATSNTRSSTSKLKHTAKGKAKAKAKFKHTVDQVKAT